MNHYIPYTDAGGRFATFKTMVMAKANYVLRVCRTAKKVQKRFGIARSTLVRWRKGGKIATAGLTRLDNAYLLAFEEVKFKKARAAQRQAEKESQTPSTNSIDAVN